MRIRVSSLPPDGLKVEQSISLENLNQRMKEGRDTDIIFTQAPMASVTVYRTASGAETKGKVSSKYQQACSHCSENIEKEVEVEANFILSFRDPENQTAEQPEDDIGILYYEGDYIELEEALQEALILSLSLYWHPPVDKKGNCVRCGLDVKQAPPEEKEAGTSLGQLMKKAGLKVQ